MEQYVHKYLHIGLCVLRMQIRPACRAEMHDSHPVIAQMLIHSSTVGDGNMPADTVKRKNAGKHR